MLVSSAAAQCRIELGRFDPSTCVCSLPATSATTCPNSTLLLSQASKACAARGVGFKFNNLTCDCLSSCPEGEDYATIQARCLGSGFAFDDRACTCVPVPPPTVDCGPFPSCTAATPCLTALGTCEVASRSSVCKMCTSFGSGGGVGSVCPDGTDFAVAKKQCLSFPGATINAIDCSCDRVATSTCPNKMSLLEASSACLTAFIPENCTCVTSANTKNCPSGTPYEVSKRECLLVNGLQDPSKTWDPVTCECGETPTGVNCSDVMNRCATQVEAGLNVSYLAATATQPCACVLVVPTVLARPKPTLYEVVFKVGFSNASVDQVKELYLSFYEPLQAQFAEKFPNSSLVALGLDGSAIRFAIRSSTQEEADSIKALVRAFLSSPDFAKVLADKIPSATASLASASAVAAVTADQPIGASATSAPTEDKSVNAAPIRSAAFALALAALFALL